MPPRGPQPGDIIANGAEEYRLDAMIGTGGMGAVWSASVEGNDDARVAIKFLHSAMASDPLIVQRFLLEARAGIEIRHPNVVSVITQGWLQPPDPADDACPWLAMELLSGKSLGDTIKLRGRIDAVDALAIAADVTAGVAAAHDKGIVHRDIKPGNVFLQQTDDGVVPKLLDFGISKYVEPGMDGGLTSTGAIVGSALYMSPEQAAGGYNVDKRSDVWSLGVVLYRMLTGESPLPATGQQEVLVLLSSPKELDLSALKHPRIPEGAAEVVKKCLRKKREERYPSACELEPELRKILAAEIARSHTPNIDSLLRPASSRATFIAAPVDATPEPAVPTAVTGAGVVVAKPSLIEPVAATMPAGAGFVVEKPSLIEPVAVTVATGAGGIVAAPIGPTAPRAVGPSFFAKAGAIALGIALVGVGVFAYQHMRMAETSASRVPEPAPMPSMEPEVEIVEVPAPTPSETPSESTGTMKPARTVTTRAVRVKSPTPTPAPKPSVEPWRKPGF